MKILVINQIGTNRVINSNFVPRIGDSVDLFYSPLPRVTCVVAWPNDVRLREVGIEEKIDVIIIVG